MIELPGRFLLVEGFFVVIAHAFCRPLTPAHNQISSRSTGSASLRPGLKSAVDYADSLNGSTHKKFGSFRFALYRLNETTKDVGAVAQLGPIAFRFRQDLEESLAR